MKTGILKEVIDVIKTEQQLRASRLTKEYPNYAYDRWIFTDEPFVNELCLMLLVTLSHQVERELVGLAARIADDGKEISREQYQEKIDQLRKKNKKTGKNIGWKMDEIKNLLELDSCKDYSFMKALRLLANSYKHDPAMEPDEDLLNLLTLPIQEDRCGKKIKVYYAPLPESGPLREGFATFLGLEKDTDYCDIAKRFVDIAINFLEKVRMQNRTKLSQVKRGKVSLTDFAR